MVGRTRDHQVIIINAFWKFFPFSTVLSWLLIYLIENPQVQKRIHEEMDSVIGSDRLITTSDRTQLPYTSAVVYEALR
jgi:cytochrome P450